MIKGGKRGRTAALLVVLVIVCSDQLSSFVIKPLVNRPRPCHTVEGVPVVENVHLLVGCGGGKSFPSSHAVNNFAVATLFAFFYKRARVWLFLWAFLVAFSRVAVGVHFPLGYPRRSADRIGRRRRCALALDTGRQYHRALAAAWSRQEGTPHG